MEAFFRQCFENANFFCIVFDLLHELVDLVPHLGGGEVVGRGLGVLTGAPLDAGELVHLAGSVHHEAHASGEVGLLDEGLAVSGPAGASDGEEAEAEDEGLDHQEDEQVGQVERQHLGGGGRPGQELHGGGDQLALIGVGGGQARGHDGCSVQVFHPDWQR